MTKPIKSKTSQSSLVRTTAEQIFKQRKEKKHLQLSDSDALKLIHELEVHQIELEMQNEELLHARTDLQLSIDKYTDLYDFAPSGYITVTERSVITDLNLNGAVLLGKERSLLKNSNFNSYLSAESRSVFSNFLKRSFESNLKNYCEISILKTGSAPIYANVSGIVPETNELCYITITDVTQQKLSARLLKESEERLNEAQKLAHIGVWDWKRSTDTVTWTDELYRIAGLDPKLPAPTYKDHSKLYSPASFELLNTSVGNALKTGEPYQVELELIHPDGEIHHVKAFGGAKFDAKGQVIGLFGTVQDITERKRAEKKLIESEQKYRGLIDGMRDTAWVINFNGDIIDVNETASKVLGYSKKELISTGLFGIDSSLKKEKILALAKAMPMDKQQTFETTHRSKDGRIIPVEVSSSLIQYHGEKAILSIARDITERIKMDSELKNNQMKLEQKLDELERFNRITIDRELRMVEIKEEINKLLNELGRPSKYKIAK